MSMNAGEQYGRNGGFENFDIGESGAGAEALKESVWPFAVIQAANIPINVMRSRRARDMRNVGEAISEGRKILPGVPAGINSGQTCKA